MTQIEVQATKVDNPSCKITSEGRSIPMDRWYISTPSWGPWSKVDFDWSKSEYSIERHHDPVHKPGKVGLWCLPNAYRPHRQKGILALCEPQKGVYATLYKTENPYYTVEENGKSNTFCFLMGNFEQNEYYNDLQLPKMKVSKENGDAISISTTFRRDYDDVVFYAETIENSFFCKSANYAQQIFLKRQYRLHALGDLIVHKLRTGVHLPPL